MSTADKIYEDGKGNKSITDKEHQKGSGFKSILADILIAALLLDLFALYYFILPRNLNDSAKKLSSLSEIKKAVTATEMRDATGEAVSEESAWSVKFADKFTEGQIEQTDNSYRSANISVGTEKVKQDGVTYYVADIYLSDTRYFKTAFAKGIFGRGIHDATNVIAEENDAVLAINGDYSGNNAGPVVRNGVLYRDEVYQDALVMYDDGSMETFAADELDMDDLSTKGIWQVWTFGPMLLDEGRPMETFNSTLNPKNPRTAIGYYEQGHYCFVVVDGRQPGYSDGMTLKEMSMLFYKLGCVVAFNLDGGQSSEMSFLGEFVNKPYKGGRGTSDIVYIADQK